jgi:hypothetical protein
VAEIVKSTRKNKEKHKESEVSRYYLVVVDAITSFTPIRNAPAVAAAAAKAPPVRSSDWAMMTWSSGAACLDVARGRRGRSRGRPSGRQQRLRCATVELYHNSECRDLEGFLGVESPKTVRCGRSLRRRTPPGGGTKIDPRRGGWKGEFRGAPKVGKKRFFPRRKNSQPSTAQGSRRRTPVVGMRRDAKRLSSPTRRGRSAGERKSDNRGKTGKNGVFRRLFEKTRGDTSRNDVRRTRPEATDASAQSASIGARRAKSQVRKTDGKKSKTGRFEGNVRNRRRTGRRRRRATKLGGRTQRRVGTTPEIFVSIGRAVRTPRTLARDHPPSVARGDRNANRRGPSSNASSVGHGRKPNKKNRENRRRRSKVIDDFASVVNRVRSNTSVRTHVTTATRSSIGPRSSRQWRRWRSGQSVGRSSRRWQVRFRGQTFLLFFAIEVCDESEISETSGHDHSPPPPRRRRFEYGASQSYRTHALRPYRERKALLFEPEIASSSSAVVQITIRQARTSVDWPGSSVVVV